MSTEFDNIKTNQFFKKLCKNNITTNKFALNKINSKDSSKTQALKFSNYIQNGTYMKIYEGKVKELYTTNTTANSATIAFVPVGYPKTITLSLQNKSNSNEYQSINTLTSPYTFQQLSTYSNYDITTTAYYSSGNKYIHTFTNAIQTANEGPPRNVKISKITNKSAYIDFIFPIGNYDSINITITNVNDSADIQNINGITTNSYSITGLHTNSTYKFAISSIYNLTQNIYSITFQFTTLEGDSPINPIFSNITNTSATISYEYVDNPLNNIISVINANNTSDIITQETSGNSIVISDLTRDISYNVSITSFYKSGYNYQLYIPNAFHILNEGSPSNIQITTKGTSIAYSFIHAIGNPYLYELILTNTQSPYNSIVIDFSVNNMNNITYESVSNLITNTSYTFNLKSIYSTGNTYNYTTSFKTLNEGPITNFSITDISNTYISFSYTNPPGDNYNMNLIVTSNNSIINTINNLNINTINNLNMNTNYNLSIQTIYTLDFNSYTYNYPYIVTTTNI